MVNGAEKPEKDPIPLVSEAICDAEVAYQVSSLLWNKQNRSQKCSKCGDMLDRISNLRKHEAQKYNNSNMDEWL